MKKTISALFLSFAFLFLLIYPKMAVQAASKSLTLWLYTLVPTLLPIMIISNLFIHTGLATWLAHPFFPLCRNIFGISIYGTYALISGFLCGFPMGAKILSDLYDSGKISKEEAHFLCPICNNISPAFTINYLFVQHMHTSFKLFDLLLIIYSAPLVYGLINRYLFNKKKRFLSLSSNKASFTAPNFAMIDACIVNGIQNITKLGGYILLFSVFTEMLHLLPSAFSVIYIPMTVLTELTTGIQSISSMPYPSELKNILHIITAVFGGFCTAAQSQSMLQIMKMPLHQYLKSRLLITVIAVIFSVCYLF